MKRSEMLKIILKDLNNNFEKSKTICPTSLDFAGIAHDILFHIEKAGMLPPFYHKQVPNLVEALNEFPEQFYDWEEE